MLEVKSVVPDCAEGGIVLDAERRAPPVSGGVTKDTTIGAVVKDFPAAVGILAESGVHCIGCHASPFETIEEGLRGHGLTDEDVATVVRRMNSALKSNGKIKGIELTESAVRKVKSLTSTNGNSGKGLRVNVKAGGCSGHMYEFRLENKPSSKDHVIEKDGVKVFITSESLNMLEGANIDYVDTLQGAGFKVSNPNAKSTCGCGESFR